MPSKARIQKRLYYKIGEACKLLDIQPYVLRYWETEFPALSPVKSRSGQRVYSEKELAVIRRIKELLYEEGFTIAGAKKKLEAELAAGALDEQPSLPDLDDEETAASAPPVSEAAEAPADPEPPSPSPSSSLQSLPSLSSSVPTAASAPPDDQAAQQARRLRAGVEQALGEAREILDLLDVRR